MKLSEICIVNTWSERFNTHGKLSLLHVNDTLHVVEYKDPERSIAVDVDFVELSSLDNTIRFTFPRGSGDRLVFKVDDEAEFSILGQAKEDCQAICDLKLRLNSIMRDSYYSGLYSNLDPDAKLGLCEEMDRLKKENPGLYFSSLLNSNELRVDMANRPPKQHKHSMDSNSIHLSDVVCVFCAASKVLAKDLDFVIHPNVPKSSNGKSNYMCSICVENWKEYREIAEHEGQLVLPGEINEEICAICSDTPSTLVLCADCPRSFCNNCLTRVLTPSEYDELMSSDDVDWICVCCTAGVSRNPPLARTAWKMVGPGNGKRCTIVPYSKAAQTAAVSKALILSPSEPHDVRMDYVIDAAVAQSAPLLTSLAGRRTSAAVVSALQLTAPNQHVADDDEHSLLTTRRRTASSKLLEKTPPPPSKAARTGSKGGKYEESDVLVTLQAQNKASNSLNNRNKRMEKRYRGQPVGGLAADTVDANGAPVLDEKYYFTQYVGYYNLLCEDLTQRQSESTSHKGKPGKRKRAAEILTDDVCFLCKDGGELIECDWQCPSAKNGERCLKVYHTYCLDFDVSESDEKWCCPRHYCDMCGSQTLKYICKYCPISICANCPEKMVAKYGNARYCAVTDPLAGVWCHTPNAPGMQSIVCQSCTEMLEQIVNTHGTNGTAPKEISISCNSMTGIKGNAPFAVLQGELQNQKRFPGTYLGETEGAGSTVFRREPPAGSSDERTSITEPIVFPVRKPPVKAKGHGKGHRRTGGNTRWTDEESEALLEAAEIHGDDAQAIKADPEFAARLARRTEESIKQKMERENMFGDTASDEDSANEEDENEHMEEVTALREENVAGSAIDVDVAVASKKKGGSGGASDGPSVHPVVGSSDIAEVVPAVETAAELPLDTASQPFSTSASVMGKGKTNKPPSATRSESSVSVSVPVSVVDANATRGRSPRATSSTPSNVADDASIASSHRSAASKVTASTSAPSMPPVSRSSPRHAPAEEGPSEKPAPKSSTATAATSTSSSTASMNKASASTAAAKADEPRAKAKNNELKSLLQDNLVPLPPRRKGKPAAAPAQTPALAEKSDSESGSDDEVETIQVPRVLTRRQELEQEQSLLSTRSGKKLFLAGTDLLP